MASDTALSSDATLRRSMKLVIETVDPQDNSTSSPLVEKGEALAWGIETATGRARHISELPRERTGAACGMTCVGCGKPLLAFNAGALTWKRRPHFYHPSGTKREDCHFIAGRLAAIERLTRAGMITLPARRMSGRWVGLSGTHYEVWRNVPEEAVRLSSVRYRDRTRALITLADGRRFVVMLRGEFTQPGADAQGKAEAGLACLVIEAGPNAHLLSQMDPDQLREQLTLLPTDMDWMCHWNDDALVLDAQQGALAEARARLDALPVNMDPGVIQGETPERRRESLLHELVRQMVAAAGTTYVPGWHHPAEPGDIRLEPGVPAHRLTLSNLRVERRLAGRIPDIQCSATSHHPSLSLDLLVIEVVVYSDVSETKLQELRAAGAAVLCLNLRDWGGNLTFNELRELTLNNPQCKRWLFHPLKGKQERELAASRANMRAWSAWRCYEPASNQRSRPAPQAPLDEDRYEELMQLGRRYRETAIAYLTLLPHPVDQISSEQLLQLAPRRAELWVELGSLAKDLERLGAPGGADATALHDVMPRILTIREDRGIGQAPSQNSRTTINNVWTELKGRDAKDDKPAKASPFAAIEYLAYQVYELDGRKRQAKGPAKEVASRLRASLEAMDPRFEWDRLYLPLILAVFPELRPGIDRLARRMNAIADQRGA